MKEGETIFSRNFRVLDPCYQAAPIVRSCFFHTCIFALLTPLSLLRLPIQQSIVHSDRYAKVSISCYFVSLCEARLALPDLAWPWAALRCLDTRTNLLICLSTRRVLRLSARHEVKRPEPLGALSSFFLPSFPFVPFFLSFCLCDVILLHLPSSVLRTSNTFCRFRVDDDDARACACACIRVFAKGRNDSSFSWSGEW